MFIIKGVTAINSVLSTITNVFLDLQSDLHTLKENADAYFEFLVSSVNQNSLSFEEQNSITTEFGRAISSFEAAHCIKEFYRTTQFLRAVHRALIRLKSMYPNETIRVLYAGTGPFAALALPMMTLFSDKEVQFTLIEINPKSMSLLKQTIERLHLSSYIEAYYLADASKLVLSSPHVHHLLISETMQQALNNEPQVSILLNLLDQVRTDAFMIPERIDVRLARFNTKQYFETQLGHGCHEFNKPIAKVLSVNQSTLRNWLQMDWRNVPFKEMCNSRIEIEPYIEGEVLYLLTEIKVFDEFKLTLNECSLNMPLKLKGVEGYKHKSHYIDFYYQLGPKPKVVWSFGGYCREN